VSAVVDPTTLPPREPQAPATCDAVLLVSFGGPEGQEDVLPFLRNVTRGRGIPDERLEEVAHHYRAFGGVSPINAQNRALKAELERELAARGIALPVLWGNRNWDPYLADALREAHAAGRRDHDRQGAPVLRSPGLRGAVRRGGARRARPPARARAGAGP